MLSFGCWGVELRVSSCAAFRVQGLEFGEQGWGDSSNAFSY